MFYKKLAVAVVAALSLQPAVYAESNADHTDMAKSATTQIPVPHWNYAGDTSPCHWGQLSEQYAACGTGKKQSPVNITVTESVKSDLPILQFNYAPIPLTISNNGHTVLIAADKAGNLTLDKDVYQLVQFHTHVPSEEAINGKKAEMVIHLVHKNAEGQLAVVAVLWEKGAANPTLEAISKVLPKTPSDPKQLEVKIDLNQLLPKDKNYFTYEG